MFFKNPNLALAKSEGVSDHMAILSEFSPNSQTTFNMQPAEKHVSSQAPKAFEPNDWPIAWMARIERQHARNSNALLAPLGMHHREFRLLAFLGSQPDISIGQLAELAVLERPTVSKMIDRMASEGWVLRGTHAGDGRRAPLTLSDLGREKLQAATPLIEGLFQNYQSGMSAAQRVLFVSELKTFFQSVQNPFLGAPQSATAGHRKSSTRQFKT
jgi:DNA-binding MarR family transcriptional regulator